MQNVNYKLDFLQIICHLLKCNCHFCSVSNHLNLHQFSQSIKAYRKSKLLNSIGFHQYESGTQNLQRFPMWICCFLFQLPSLKCCFQYCREQQLSSVNNTKRTWVPICCWRRFWNPCFLLPQEGSQSFEFVGWFELVLRFFWFGSNMSNSIEKGLNLVFFLARW